MLDGEQDYFKEIPNRDRVSRSKIACLDRIGVNHALKFTGHYLGLLSLKEVEDPLPFVSTAIDFDLLPNTKNEAIKSRNFGYDNGFAKTKEIAKQIAYESQKMIRKVDLEKMINEKTINVRSHQSPRSLASHQPVRVSSFPKCGSECCFQNLNPINETNSLSSSISDRSEVDNVEDISNQDEQDKEDDDNALILEEEDEEEEDSEQSPEEDLPYVISEKKKCQLKSNSSESQYYDEKENIPVKLVVFKKTRSGKDNSLRYSTPVKSSPTKMNKRTSNRSLKSSLFSNQVPTRMASAASSENSSHKLLPYFRYSSHRELSSVEIDNDKSFQSFVRPSDVTLRDLLISGVLSDRISIAESDRTSETNHQETRGDSSASKARLKNHQFQRKSNVVVDASKRHSFSKIIKPDMRIHKFESESFKDSLDYMKQIL